MFVMNSKADLVQYVGSGEWDLITTELKRHQITYPIDQSNYTDITLYVCMKRRALYYIINIIIPCVWLNLLSTLQFYVPPEAGEKVSLGITVLLSYSVFMLLVADSMPPTSDFVPLIGIYLTFSMGITSISVIVTVWNLNMHHCGFHHKRVPLILRKLLFRFFTSRYPLSYTLEDPNNPNSEQQNNTIKSTSFSCKFRESHEPPRKSAERSPSPCFTTNRKLHSNTLVNNSSNHTAKSPNTSSYRANFASESYELDDDKDSFNSSHHNTPLTSISANEYQLQDKTSVSRNDNNKRSNRISLVNTTPLAEDTADQSTLSMTTAANEVDMLHRWQEDTRRVSHQLNADSIGKMIGYLQRRLSNISASSSEREALILAEWRNLARLMDRIMFGLFLFIMAASSVILLIIIPVSDHDVIAACGTLRRKLMPGD